MRHNKKKIEALIFARGGSKGVKNKNIRLLNGIPLIGHSIKCALACDLVGGVTVSTDDQAIAEVSEYFGASVLARPDSLADDHTPELLAWRHAIENLPNVFGSNGQEIFLSTPATSPFRSNKDIQKAVEVFNDSRFDIVMGVTPSTKSPSLNMVTFGTDLELTLLDSADKSFNRQLAPKTFDVTTVVYVASVNHVRTCEKIFSGRVGGIQIPAERSLDIDTEYDFHIAKLLANSPFKSEENK